MPVLKKVPVQWASVLVPNTKFEHAWEVQVELTKDQADDLQAEAKALHKKGIKITQEEDKFFFRFKRKVHRADGTGDNNPPVVKGPDGEEFTKLIGNGSVCNVQYGLVRYDNAKFGSGVTTDLKGIRVLVHVPFGEQDGEGLDDDVDVNSSNSEYDEDF
jgi:hypothetical protein